MKNDGKKADIYSFGMIIYSIIYDSYPYPYPGPHPGPHVLMIINRIIDGEKPPLDDNDWKSFNELIQKCWNKQPNKRPNFEEIIHSLIEIKSEFVKRNVIDETEVNNFLLYTHYDISFKSG